MWRIPSRRHPQRLASPRFEVQPPPHEKHNPTTQQHDDAAEGEIQESRGERESERERESHAVWRPSLSSGCGGGRLPWRIRARGDDYDDSLCPLPLCLPLCCCRGSPPRTTLDSPPRQPEDSPMVDNPPPHDWYGPRGGDHGDTGGGKLAPSRVDSWRDRDRDRDRDRRLRNWATQEPPLPRHYTPR